jgi:uncharacterized membrane protein YvlD (DUF360 family)
LSLNSSIFTIPIEVSMMTWGFFSSVISHCSFS